MTIVHKHSIVKGWAIGITLMLLSTGALQGKTLKAGIVDFRPFYIVNGVDELGGSIYTILVKILDRAGYDYTIKGYPPKRLYTYLARGNADVYIGIKQVPLYQKQVLFSKTSIRELKLRIFGLPDTKMPEHIEGLAGEKVIALAGYGYGGYRESFLDDPRNKVELVISPNHEHAFRMLKARVNGVKYLLDYERPSKEALKKVHIAGIQTVPVFNLKTYIIVSRKTQDAGKVLAKLEKAYLELRKEGAVD